MGSACAGTVVAGQGDEQGGGGGDELPGGGLRQGEAGQVAGPDAAEPGDDLEEDQPGEQRPGDPAEGLDHHQGEGAVVAAQQQADQVGPGR